MPQNTQTYFGIRFTSEFPAGKEDRFRLAKVLFCNPSISPRDAFRMLSNIDLWPCPDALITRMEQEADHWKKSKEKEEIEQEFRKKLSEWVKLFSFPSMDELSNVGNELEIPVNEMMEAFLVAIGDLPPSKMMDFLRKYRGVLRADQVNQILDHFNETRYKQKPVVQIQLKFNE